MYRLFVYNGVPTSVEDPNGILHPITPRGQFMLRKDAEGLAELVEREPSGVRVRPYEVVVEYDQDFLVEAVRAVQAYLRVHGDENDQIGLDFLPEQRMDVLTMPSGNNYALGAITTSL